jgi:hypothetical protein
VSTPGKPDLDQLVAALIADAQAEELGGRDSALAAFRAARRRGVAAGSAWYRNRSFRRPFTRLSGRLTAVGAALAVAAGVTAAAYTQALPGPVQQLAHTVFAPLGVPNGQTSPGTTPGTGPTGITVAQTGGRTKKASPSARTPSPKPGSDYLVAVAVSRTRVPSGTAVAFTGRVTDGGRTIAGVRVRLFERIAGTTAEELVATAVTGPRGGYRLVSPPLTATAVFRVVAGPDTAHSVAVRVAVASQ